MSAALASKLAANPMSATIPNPNRIAFGILPPNFAGPVPEWPPRRAGPSISSAIDRDPIRRFLAGVHGSRRVIVEMNLFSARVADLPQRAYSQITRSVRRHPTASAAIRRSACRHRRPPTSRRISQFARRADRLI
jgi:hypothetical protein